MSENISRFGKTLHTVDLHLVLFPQETTYFAYARFRFVRILVLPVLVMFQLLLLIDCIFLSLQIPTVKGFSKI